MSRQWLFLFLFCLALLAGLSPLSRAALSLRINESAIRVLFEEQGSRVILPIENSLAKSTSARIKIEVIDTDDASIVTVEKDYQIKPGANELTIPLAMSLRNRSDNARELLWYRLNYSITPIFGSAFDPITNVVSLSEITPDLFNVSVATARKAQPGSAYRVRVKTAHPLTAKPVAAVNVTAQIKFDGTERPDVILKQTARTDANGFATIDFQIPRQVEGDEGEIVVTATHGIVSETSKEDVEVDRAVSVMVSTDKPLYQPGQTLHARVLMFDASRHAIAGGKATLKVSDPESTMTFRADIESSRFGVASVDWPIPENTRLGDYRVEVNLDDDKFEDSYGATTVKISRYDLPNFTVNVKPDRPFYLAGQNADVEVRADYLFGQPVKRGHVRVVRETERRWDYREQKWKTEEGEKYEGDTNSEGKFFAHVKLEAEHDKLKDEDYSRYTDLTYAAYFTDPTTNRTEQRRFDLRVTKDAIHLYIVSRVRQVRNLPLDFYISASYADGTPAACEVALSRVWDKGKAQTEAPVQTIKTDVHGLAKFRQMLPNDPNSHKVSLIFRARDDGGRTGEHTEEFELDDTRAAVRISTDKALYRDGEPIRAEITAYPDFVTLALDTVNEERVIQSQLVQIKNGHASILIPYRKELTGAVTLVAYALSLDKYDEDSSFGSRAVLYPHDRDLKLKLDLNRETYRPGEEATANFLTRVAAGRGAESALGVVIFDKAVEERARTD
ncbi:MAG TPA: MG2 domain-containing protein, partial [Pyrinomonadaceae bacterium]|nr:MG2 domain-containing protein [Pyrinomonadaceae bacterium]